MDDKTRERMRAAAREHAAAAPPLTEAQKDAIRTLLGPIAQRLRAEAAERATAEQRDS